MIQYSIIFEISIYQFINLIKKDFLLEKKRVGKE